MHADQLHVRADQARDLIHDQFPQFRGEDVVALATAGTVNAIFRIGASHVARFPLRMMDAADCARLLQAEAQASAEFGRFSPFPGPETVGFGRPGSGYPLPWLVQTWIDGEVATPDGLCGSSAFALDLARLIASLRAAPLRGRTFDGRGRGGNLADHDAWMEKCFSRSGHLLDVERLRGMWRGFRELPPPTGDVMSHKDLIPANLLVRDGRLAGVLDTGSFGAADPALDLVAGWHLLDRETRAIFREALRIGDAEWRRGAAWAFQQAMGLVWYYELTNPIMSGLGRSTISRLLADPPE